jgi:hypothetical protein
MFLLPKNYYSVKKIRNKGRGVFVAKTIEAGTVIGDYMGMIINDSQIAKHEKACGEACYAMDYDGNGHSIFPADVKASGVHLINHSCSANCGTYYDRGHTLFFALRRLFPGEELSIDYSFDPSGDGVVNNRRELLHPCYCNSPFCRGTMYNSQEKIDRLGDYFYRQNIGRSFEAQKAGEKLKPLADYPKSINDDEAFDLYASMEEKPLILRDDKLPSIKELRRQLRASGRRLRFSRFGFELIGVSGDNIIINK